MKKIVFYYHHFGGFGHISRIKNICTEILSNFKEVKIYIINSGKDQGFLGFSDKIKIVNLPEAFISKKNFEVNEVNSLNFKKREKFLSFFVDRIKPDVFLFEHYPFGRDFLDKEAVKLILKLKSTKCKIYSSVRDIVTQKINKTRFDKIIKLFNGILIHGEEKNSFMPNNIKEKYRDIICYTGLIYDEKLVEMKKRSSYELKENEIKKGKNKNKEIVVSFGGGIGRNDIINSLILLINKNQKYNWRIFTGLEISDKEYNKICEKIIDKEKVIVSRFSDNFINYFATSFLNISMAGYNSICNSLILDKKSIIIPRLRDSEQHLRARIYQKHLIISEVERLEQDFNKAVKVLNQEKIDAKNKNKNGKRIKHQVNHEIKNVFNHETKDVFNHETKDVFNHETKEKNQYKLNLVKADLKNIFYYILYCKSIKLRLTSKCNLDCDMCSWKNTSQELSYSDVKKIIYFGRFLGVEYINLTGGEPTLHKDFTKIVEKIEEQNLKCSVSSNSYNINKLKSKSIKYIDSSIDSGIPEIHDSIRGKEGCYLKVFENLKKLKELKKILSLNITVRPDNYTTILELLKKYKCIVRDFNIHLVDNSILNEKKLVFKKEDIYSFFFCEVVEILKYSIEENIDVKIFPLSEIYKGYLNDEILLIILLETDRYRKELFSYFRKSNCIIRDEISLRINNDKSISFCCFMDDNIENMKFIDNIKYSACKQLENFKLNKIESCKKCNKNYKYISEYEEYF